MSSTVWWRVDVQIALGAHDEVDHAVARDLVEHVVEERDARGELRIAGAIEVELDADLGLLGVALHVRALIACAVIATAFHDRAQRLDQFRVLLGCSDREPQALGEQRMRAVRGF